MSAYDRASDEQWPTGTFGHALPPAEPPPRPITPWTPEEQAQHVRDLLEGLAGWVYREPDPEEPRLRIVGETAATGRARTDAA